MPEKKQKRKNARASDARERRSCSRERSLSYNRKPFVEAHVGRIPFACWLISLLVKNHHVAPPQPIDIYLSIHV
ncbi:Uncharacterized protein TCM_020237 [Theobroma cacao]|uniref:Uncharacterized protein n=1 Tax=Theobroma cacao TaxID=3641 RepID=A0A061EKL4_THECC|nr:Uncharacterized protein TCM_020237 [Theobroma cacao]